VPRWGFGWQIPPFSSSMVMHASVREKKIKGLACIIKGEETAYIGGYETKTLVFLKK
jgi:hypothetical protein